MAIPLSTRMALTRIGGIARRDDERIREWNQDRQKVSMMSV